MEEEIRQLAAQYQFFHWHLAFPEVFANGGFDVVLGNPPWERVKLQEKEWFAERSPEIANAPNAAARKRLIAGLKTHDSTLYQQFLDGSRQAEGESHILRNSGRYPLCGRGDINVYTVFAEGMRNQLNAVGRMGCVLPSGIATDDTTKFYFQDVVERQSLVSLFDFENKNIFPSVHSSYKFCLFTAGNGERPTVEAADFVFFAHGVEDLRDSERRFTLSPQDIALLNPNTRTCPIFRSRRDAELTKAIYRRVPVLNSVKDSEYFSNINNKKWEVTLFTMLHSSGAAHLFLDRAALQGTALPESNYWYDEDTLFVPLYEGKMFHQFDHRFASVVMTDNLSRPAQPVEASISDHQVATWLPSPRAWVDEREIKNNCPSNIHINWFLGYKDVGSSTNERTLIATILPHTAIVDSINIVGILEEFNNKNVVYLLGNFNSFILDYIVRQKIGGLHIKFYLLNQLPILPPTTYTQPCPWSGNGESLRDWLLPRVLELTYTAWDLEPFAQDYGFNGPPFRWDEARRFLLSCELDAAFFHLYGIERDDVAYIMDTFPIVKRRDEAAHGSYRTKDTILEIYDAMIGGQPYQTRLEPPPADVQCCHPPR
jgi:hypothetical protein